MHGDQIRPTFWLTLTNFLFWVYFNWVSVKAGGTRGNNDQKSENRSTRNTRGRFYTMNVYGKGYFWEKKKRTPAFMKNGSPLVLPPAFTNTHCNFVQFFLDPVSISISFFSRVQKSFWIECLERHSQRGISVLNIRYTFAGKCWPVHLRHRHKTLA